MRSFAIGAAALGLFLISSSAFAENEAAAEALFIEAKKLAAAGKYAEACPKFAASNKLDRGAGTMIHLADCYEKNKQTASAWATYKEAASAAQAINRKEWEKLANDRSAALEKKLAHLTIKVADERAAVTRDGTPMSKAEWGVAIPVDVGTHAVEASATGAKAFKTAVNVAKDGDSIVVDVPKLEDEPAPPPAPNTVPPPAPQPITEPPPVEADKSHGSSQRTIGLVVGGVGVAGVAVGAVTGLMAIGKSNNAKDAGCNNDGPCRVPAAVDAADSARTLATISTIGFIAGGVGVAAGAVLFFTAPSKKAAPTTGIRVVPNAGPNAGGLTVLGSF